MAEVDWADPCARAEALRAVYYARLSGNQATRIRFRASTGEEREIESGSSNAAELRRELTIAETECAQKQGKSRLFAIR